MRYLKLVSYLKLSRSEIEAFLRLLMTLIIHAECWRERQDFCCLEPIRYSRAMAIFTPGLQEEISGSVSLPVLSVTSSPLHFPAPWPL